MICALVNSNKNYLIFFLNCYLSVLHDSPRCPVIISIISYSLHFYLYKLFVLSTHQILPGVSFSDLEFLFLTMSIALAVISIHVLKLKGKI